MKTALSEDEKVACLAAYLEGMADSAKIQGKPCERLEEAAQWLQKLSDNMCGAGVIGCKGGRDCDAAHF